MDVPFPHTTLCKLTSFRCEASRRYHVSQNVSQSHGALLRRPLPLQPAHILNKGQKSSAALRLGDILYQEAIKEVDGSQNLPKYASYSPELLIELHQYLLKDPIPVSALASLASPSSIFLHDHLNREGTRWTERFSLFDEENNRYAFRKFLVEPVVHLVENAVEGAGLIDVWSSAADPKRDVAVGNLLRSSVMVHVEMKAARVLGSYLKTIERVAKSHDALRYGTSPDFRIENKAQELLAKGVCYMVRDRARFAFLASYTQSVLLHLNDNNELFISPVISYQAKSPSPREILFAVLLLSHPRLSNSAFNLSSASRGRSQPVRLAFGGQPALEVEGKDRRVHMGSSSHLSRQKSNDGGEGIGIERKGELNAADVLNRLSLANTLKCMSLGTVFKVMSRMRLPASQSSLPASLIHILPEQCSSPPSSLTHSANLLTKDLHARASADQDSDIVYLEYDKPISESQETGITVWRIANLPSVVLKVAEAGIDLLLHEAQVYENLQLLQGSVVPRFFGMFVYGTVGQNGCLLLENVGVSLVEDTGGDDWSDYPTETRKAVFNLVCRLLAESGFRHRDLEPRNVCRTQEGSLRLIDLESLQITTCFEDAISSYQDMLGLGDQRDPEQDWPVMESSGLVIT